MANPFRKGDQMWVLPAFGIRKGRGRYNESIEGGEGVNTRLWATVAKWGKDSWYTVKFQIDNKSVQVQQQHLHVVTERVRQMCPHRFGGGQRWHRQRLRRALRAV